MTNYQRSEQLNENGYIENRVSKRMTIDWKAAVIEYASKIFKYSFFVGISIGLVTTIGMYYPTSRQEWVQAFVLIIACGLGVGGAFAALSVLVKDALYPYDVPTDVYKSLPSMAAPGNMKKQALMGIVDGAFKYGKYQMEPGQQLALANAIIRKGETSISQRKLAEWGVVATKDSQEAKQLKVDFVWTGLGEDAGNDTIKPTAAFYAWAQGIFPDLSPSPLTN